MSGHISVATAIEKNRIASDVAFIILAEIDVRLPDGEITETMYLAKNTENIEYQGKLYQATSFNVDMGSEMGEEPQLTVAVEDPTGAIREKLADYDGAIGFPVRLIILNTGNLDQPPELEEEFQVTGASQAGYTVSFTLGVENPLFTRFPVRSQSRDQCPHRYKGPRCKYAGPMSSCSYTYDGANGCKAHSNGVNFGGMRGLQSGYIA